MKYLILFTLLILNSCGPQGAKQLDSLSTSTGNTTEQSNQNNLPTSYDATSCQLSKLGIATTLGSPQNINEAVDLINALPKPLSIPCFLQALARPIRVNTTSSILSVQPAVGVNDPRIFIFSGKLVISLASAGDGKNLIEFSFMYNDTQSLKGELSFPITSTVSYTEPFTQVETGGQSSCSGCHVEELLDTNVVGTDAYRSKALKPAANRNVSVSSFYQQSYLCDFNNDSSYRCKMIRSLFENGTVMQVSFPSATPTYFDSLGF